MTKARLKAISQTTIPGTQWQIYSMNFGKWFNSILVDLWGMVAQPPATDKVLIF